MNNYAVLLRVWNKEAYQDVVRRILLPQRPLLFEMGRKK